MSNRPPGVRHRTLASTADFTDPTKPEPVAMLVGTNLRIAGVELRGAGAFVYVPQVALPTDGGPLSYTPPAPGFCEIAPAAIDPTNANWPLVIWYAPLGLGAR